MFPFISLHLSLHSLQSTSSFQKFGFSLTEIWALISWVVYAGPSSSGRRAGGDNLPEPIVEALASDVAIDAARSFGCLAAAPVLFSLFQMSSDGPNHNKFDFEFLENTTRDPYLVQINMYVNGVGNRQQRLNLWFGNYLGLYISTQSYKQNNHTK